MITRTVMTGLLAGLAAGAVLTVLYLARLEPLILAAERYELGLDAALSAPFLRIAETFLFNVLNGVGFGLLLAAALVLRGGPSGIGPGVFWGAAGFAVFVLAPAAGLPPELPGMAAAPLPDRQVWWLLTALATAAGLGLLAFGPNPALKLAGVALLIVPHLYGAPHPDGAEAGGVPAELAARFAAVSLASMALFWVVLGGVAGYCHDRFANRPGDRAAAA